MFQVKEQDRVSPMDPIRRRSAEEIRQEFLTISSHPILTQVLDAMPMICLLLNEERQIVFANIATAQFLGLEDRYALTGQRPGEALQCVHASEMGDGCGTTRYCRMCGAAQELRTKPEWGQSGHECRILRNHGMEALDLRVVAVPVVIDHRTFFVFTMTDIGHEKRRRVLERVFFHDILNTAGTIRGFSDLLSDKVEGTVRKQADLIKRLSTRLIEEIEAQRELRAAENNELEVRPTSIDAFALLEEIRQQYQNPPPARGRRLQLAPNKKKVILRSDPILLRRVLSNLVKNALEASQQEGTVLMGAEGKDGVVEFWVHNPEPMDPEVQLQVFQRSFSTKGTGRGLGTFGVRLIATKYLKGEVSFSSSPEGGTAFRVVCPKELIA